MIRKYELIRWNLYYDKVKETVEGCKQMAEDAFAGTGDLPDYLYTRLDEAGNLVILNTHEKVDYADEEVWTRQSWLISMHSESTDDGYADWITSHWANYTDPGNIGVPDGVIRYIFPIPTLGIDNSKGVLKNDGYNFGF